MEDIRNKLIQKFKDNGYYNVLKGFLLSDDCIDLLNKLQEEVDNGFRFTPPIKNVFRAFDLCPFDELKVVIVGPEPFSEVDESTGLLFDCTGKRAKQEAIFFFNGFKYKVDKKTKIELEYLAKQGVLLLNVPLTTRINTYGPNHKDIWKPFIGYLFDMLSNKNIVFVFLGSEASKYHPMVSKSSKLFSHRPISGNYSEKGYWIHDNLFDKINDELKLKNKVLIKW